MNTIWKHPDIDGQYVSAGSKTQAGYLFKTITGKIVNADLFESIGIGSSHTRIYSGILYDEITNFNGKIFNKNWV